MRKAELRQAVKLLRAEYGESLSTDAHEIGWELVVETGKRTHRLQTLEQVADVIRRHRIDNYICVECDQPTFRERATYYCELHYHVERYQRGYRSWGNVSLLRREIEYITEQIAELGKTSLHQQARILGAQREIERRGEVA